MTLSARSFVASVGIGLVIATVALIAGAITECIWEFFTGISGTPTAGVKGKERWVCDAMSGHISHGELVVTDQVAAFVPGAYRWSGKAGKSEVEVVMPLCEIADVRRRFVYLVFPFGVTIVRTSGDLEYFTVGRPGKAIREIEAARDEWRLRNNSADVTEAAEVAEAASLE